MKPLELKQINDVGCHPSHGTFQTGVKLNGIPEGLPDSPAFLSPRTLKFELNVFDYEKYLNSEGLCPADDIVSQSIAIQGVWEPFETLLMLDILSKGDKKGAVIDFGSQVGWYSIIAALEGYKVDSFDSLHENIDILTRNAKLNKVSGKITPHLGWIDEDVPILPAENIQFFKSDIEGNEQYAIKMYEESFKAKTVEYAILEISPCFNDSYPKLIHKIMDYGYDVYQVPQKRWAHTEEFAVAPLQTTLRYPYIENLDEYMKTIRQEDFLFVKKERS